MDSGREASFDWDTSEISASTSVYDTTHDESQQLNYTIMSEITSRSSHNDASCSTVPSQEAILANALAAWEHEEFEPENISSEKVAKDKSSRSKGKQRKQRKSTLADGSLFSESSENSSNYSAIQNAVLLPKVNQLYSSQAEGAAQQLVVDASLINTSLNNSSINHTSINLLQFNKEGRTDLCQSGQSSINHSERSDISYTSESASSQLNTSYTTSQNSSLASNSSLSTIGEIVPPLAILTQPPKKKVVRKSNLPTVKEEKTNKILNGPPKRVAKQKAATAKTKTKTKATQVNIKIKAPKASAGKKTIKKKLTQNKNKKQENNQREEESTKVSIPKNDLNGNMGEHFLKSEETLRSPNFVGQPTTSGAREEKKARSPETKIKEKEISEVKPKRNTVTCGYMSSSSSDEADGSYDSSADERCSCGCSGSSTYSCTCCSSYCSSYSSCSWSCSYSSSSESTDESPPRRRRHKCNIPRC